MQSGLLTLKDLSTDNILTILNLAEQNTQNSQILTGKKFAILFERTSLRTKCSFEIAINELGGFSSFIDWHRANFNKADLEDEARVLALYYDGIICRVGSHPAIECIHSVSDVPVINALTDLYHPCQALADILTIKQVYANLTEPNLVFLGPATNVSNSLGIICKKLGVNFTHCGPKDFAPSPSIVGEGMKFEHDLAKSLKDADIIYTDAWVSICFSGNEHTIVDKCTAYQLNKTTLSHCRKKVQFMHCMPISYGHEVTKDALGSMEQLHLKQAMNRIHAQKALLQWIYQ